MNASLTQTLAAGSQADETGAAFTNVRASNRPKILVVDDMPMYLMVAEKNLASSYEVSTAKSAAAALELLSVTFFDLILLDIEMPNVSGVEMFEKMLEEPDYATLPVIFVTSEKDVEVVQKVIKKGARDYIVKPYTGRTLTDKVARALKSADVDQAVLFLRRRLKTVADWCVKGNAELVERTIKEFPANVYSAFVSLKLKRILLAVRNKDFNQAADIAKEIVNGT